MRRDFSSYRMHQVFLNYPYDEDYEKLSEAMHFAVIASGKLPICAKDLSSPDRPRLEMLVHAISNCHYSAHDLSRGRGEGDDNFARMNMPIEIGMALYHALTTQRIAHRCTFFVDNPHEYKVFASDLAGLDPLSHHNDDIQLMSSMYEWLRDVIPYAQINDKPTVYIKERYAEYREKIALVRGSGQNGEPSHEEKTEVMYQICEKYELWNWRGNIAILDEFSKIPLSWKDE